MTGEKPVINAAHKRQAKQAVVEAWDTMRPLLADAVAHDEAWVRRYMPSLDDIDNYFHGSIDRFALLLQAITAQLPPGSRVLDAGAGYGFQPIAFRQAGFEAHASDIYETLPIYAPLEVHYRRWHLEADPAPYANDSFDAVVLAQTIEHFTYSPRHALEEIVRITRPGGLILIDAPNISSFHNISRLIRGKTIMWNMKAHYLEQEPLVTHGIPYYDRHNHELCRQDMRDIAEYFGLDMLACRFYSPHNKKRGRLAIAVSRIRDLAPLWRKGIYAMMRVPA
jgi:SAM-dependent methyltransferase